MRRRNVNGVQVKCSECGSMFTPARLYDRPRFCSKTCIWSFTKGPAYNSVISKASAARRGDAMRGSGEGLGYRKRNGKHEHREVIEQVIGRALGSKEVVHHRDGNKLNNSTENLEIITQGEHMRKHGLGIKGMTLPWKPWEKRRNHGA